MVSKLEEITTQQREKVMERLLQSVSGTFELFSIYLGYKLGFYQALSKHGQMTAGKLASHTATELRYVREWLEQQTVIGLLEVENKSGMLYFNIPSAHLEVFTDKESLNYLMPLVQTVVGAVHPLQATTKAYRQGGGVPYKEYGTDFVEGQAGMNRMMFLKLLGAEWLPALPDIDARLKANPPARIADIGCGAGWSSISMAQSYPKVLVDGFDLDEYSIEMARTNAHPFGLADRLNFTVRNAADPALVGQYDLVTFFECLHDMAQPVAVLQTIRKLLNQTGSVLIMDERTGESFTSEPGNLDWLFYGFSLLHCLPVGMAEQPSAGTGTVLRAETLRQYAWEAGFRALEVLPIEADFYRFYRLYV